MAENPPIVSRRRLHGHTCDFRLLRAVFEPRRLSKRQEQGDALCVGLARALCGVSDFDRLFDRTRGPLARWIRLMLPSDLSHDVDLSADRARR